MKPWTDMRIRKSLQNKGKKRTFKANQTPSSSRQNIKEQKIFVILFCADSTVDLVKFELLRVSSCWETEYPLLITSKEIINWDIKKYRTYKVALSINENSKNSLLLQMNKRNSPTLK